MEYRSLRRGPFWWRTSEGQTVYYVTIRDGRNNLRHAWIRCGGWLAGLFSDQVDVRWDE
jgi:hypothetical protein